MQLSEGVYYVQSPLVPLQVGFTLPVQPPQEWDDEFHCFGLSGAIGSEAFAATQMFGEDSLRVFCSPEQGLQVTFDGDTRFQLASWSKGGAVACVSPLGVHAIVILDVPGARLADAIPAAFGTVVRGAFVAPFVTEVDALLLGISNEQLIVEVAHEPRTSWEYEPTPVSLSPQQVSCGVFDGEQQLLYDWGLSFMVSEI